MSDEAIEESSEFTREQLLQMVRQHLASLEASGVEWLPRAPLPAIPFAQPPVTAQPSVPQPAPVVAAPVVAVAASAPNQARLELQQLADYVSKCTRCSGLAASRTQTVFGVGKIEPDLCLVGEAPGADEDRQGEPFVGAAGQLLTKILEACGLTREEVYICNIIKCRPPGNRTPEPSEVENCREYLEHQIDLVRPRFICALGGLAIKGLLHTTAPISALRGKLQRYRDIPVVCTYHPAFLLPHRSPTEQVQRDRKRMVWDDMKFLMQQMGRPVRK